MKSWIWLILDILIIALLFSACFPKEYKTVHPEFVYGSITADGKYDFEAKNSIVTKEAIACTKFKINKDFNADYTFTFYYYDANGGLVTMQKMTGDFLDVGYRQMPDDAVSIRIVISNFAGFSDWDCFRYRWWDLGLTVSTREQSIFEIGADAVADFFSGLFSSDPSDDIVGSLPEDPTGNLPDMIYPDGGTQLSLKSLH